MSGKHRKLLQALVGIGFAAFFLYLAVREIDVGEFWTRLKSVSLRHTPAILLLLLGFFGLKALRWSLLLRPIAALRARDVTPAMMIGFMGNNVLPAHLGEFARMFVLAKQYGLSKAAVLSTIVLERVLDFLVIIGIFAASLQFIPLSKELEVVRTGGYLIGAACAGIFLAFLGFVWQTTKAMAIAEAAFRFLPARLGAKILELIHLGVAGLYALKSPWLILWLLALTIVHWLLNGACLYLAVVSFPGGSPLPVLAAFFLLSVCALGVTLPSAPGYFGTIQYCFVLALGVFGLDKETAFAASIYSLLLGYFPVTIVGFYYLARLDLKLGTLSQKAEEEAEHVPEAISTSGSGLGSTSAPTSTQTSAPASTPTSAPTSKPSSTIEPRDSARGPGLTPR
jgi:uncharacterized protein (TIRG00374 family)